MWLTSNHMFDESPSWFLKNLKLSLFYSGYFKIFKNALGQFIQNRPPKHVITSTNIIVYMVYHTKFWELHDHVHLLLLLLFQLLMVAVGGGGTIPLRNSKIFCRCSLNSLKFSQRLLLFRFQRIPYNHDHL